MLPLSKNDTQALNAVLECAYRRFALYDRVLDAFGPAAPLERIRDVEAFHIHVLESLHQRYHVAPPKDLRHLYTAHFSDADEACAATVQAEKEQIALCQRLMEEAREADVLGELRNLERASRDGHLPKLHAWAKHLARESHAAARAALRGEPRMHGGNAGNPAEAHGTARVRSRSSRSRKGTQVHGGSRH